MAKSRVMLPTVPKTSEEVEAAMATGTMLDIAELARAHSEDMLGVLVVAAESEGPMGAPWPTKVAAARSVIEIGHGKAATQETETKEASLTIVVNQLFGGDPIEKTIEGVELGKAIAESVEITAMPDNLAADLVDLTTVLRKPPG